MVTSGTRYFYVVQTSTPDGTATSLWSNEVQAVPGSPAGGSLAVSWTVNGQPAATACPAGGQVTLTLTGGPAGSTLSAACTAGTLYFANLIVGLPDGTIPDATNYTLSAALIGMTAASQIVTVTPDAGTAATVNFVDAGPGSVQATINCADPACGKQGTLRVRVMTPSSQGCSLPVGGPVAIANLGGQTLVAGTPIMVTLESVPAGSQCIRAFLDVNDDGAQDTGDAISNAGNQAVTVSSGQTTAVTVTLDVIAP